MKILLISSVLPKDTTGGEVVLFRHLYQLSEVSVAIAKPCCKQMPTDTSDCLLAEDIIEVKPNPILHRLNTTRFSRWAHDIRQCFNTFDNCHKIEDYIQDNKPDLILTVAHGELWWVAQQISHKFNIPLVTFFHDWWPDSAYVHNWARKIIARRFQRLYQKSSLAFCVSEGMQQALGKHSNAQIWPPIPDLKQAMIYRECGVESASNITSKEVAIDGKFQVVYAGNLSDIYGSMVQSLCRAYKEINEFQLTLFGLQPDWSDSLREEVKKQGIYGGFLPRDLLKNQLTKANTLLVAMSFEEQDKKRMETSFPSKLVDYCQFGKPIIIWGPEYCSAVCWGREHQSALLVTSPLAQDLVNAIKELANNREEQQRLGHKALAMAQGMFNPENIQQQFLESLQQVAGKRR